MTESDAELVQAARAGRHQAYEELIGRHGGRIAAACLAKVRRRAEAEDLTQETFLRGWKALNTLEDPDRFGSWLHGIAVRTCLDRLKDREWSQLPMSALPSGGDVHGPADVPAPGLELSEERGRLLAKVGELPEIYRDVVVLFYLEQRSYEQMSVQLGIKPAAINARLHKARIMLRERLKNLVT